MIRCAKIKAIDDSIPFDSLDWRTFLSGCKIKDKVQGVTFFRDAYHNYILFPNGALIRNHDYQGKRVMERVRELGWETVHAEFLSARNEIDDLLSELGD